ncbi:MULTISPECIES: hypothetical protein [Bacillaceae]|uniref:Uncharacterized protein n=1 Tax=Peribacillus huizhouensis TaxID=1501239 RepID=A0ABR6CM21_9BACI|nr:MULTISPECIES: hypothetical protein [Bacillaceae]MBA9026099.1 hypothetical protein [Peribacillus huizhouensis]
MEQKPNHYDGSVSFDYAENDEAYSNELYQITDEMRLNIGGNPYFFDVSK